MHLSGRSSVVVALGITQRLAWTSSSYHPAMLAGSIGKDVGTSTSVIFGAFSVALLVAAAVDTYARRLIGRLGGRPILVVSNCCLRLGSSR